MKFFLGTHRPGWLRFSTVPLFVSDRTLKKYRTLPIASCDWSLDSGGFSELSMYGRWTVGSKEYADRVCLYRDWIGRFQWASIQDYMCEPFILKKTGLSVREHQARTIDSYIDLKSRAPDVAWLPVVQGFEANEYLRHVDDYQRRGIDLRDFDTVGVGSVCRREGTLFANTLFSLLSLYGIKPHGFGVKTSGLRKYQHVLSSADSMAWSFGARKTRKTIRCPLGKKTCANCWHKALSWRNAIVDG